MLSKLPRCTRAAGTGSPIGIWLVLPATLFFKNPVLFFFIPLLFLSLCHRNGSCLRGKPAATPKCNQMAAPANISYFSALKERLAARRRGEAAILGYFCRLLWFNGRMFRPVLTGVLRREGMHWWGKLEKSVKPAAEEDTQESNT